MTMLVSRSSTDEIDRNSVLYMVFLPSDSGRIASTKCNKTCKMQRSGIDSERSVFYHIISKIYTAFLSLSEQNLQFLYKSQVADHHPTLLRLTKHHSAHSTPLIVFQYVVNPALHLCLRVSGPSHPPHQLPSRQPSI